MSLSSQLFLNNRFVKISSKYSEKKIPRDHFLTRVELGLKIGSLLPGILINSNFSKFPLEDKKVWLNSLKAKMEKKNKQSSLTKEYEKLLKEIKKFLEIR